jgi:Class III cytochrome C family
MKPRLGLIGIGVSLLLLALSVFLYPHVMIAPGPLIAEHNALTKDCFACHVPFRGASATRCIACHKPAAIGIFTTKAIRIKSSSKKIAFHGQLIEPNCVACHSDHSGPRLTRHVRKPFAHSLLVPAIRSRCESCHRVPATPLHSGIRSGCASCHNVSGWRRVDFNHERYFRLDGDHDAACATCHRGTSYRQYSCFGCHEHKQGQIIAKHAEEGIRNINNCVRCHRSSDEIEDGEGREGGDD